jgi:hypothetical protein
MARHSTNWATTGLQVDECKKVLETENASLTLRDPVSIQIVPLLRLAVIPLA